MFSAIFLRAMTKAVQGFLAANGEYAFFHRCRNCKATAVPMAVDLTHTDEIGIFGAAGQCCARCGTFPRDEDFFTGMYDGMVQILKMA